MMVPTGFRFNPTDEELIQLLERKVSGQEMLLHYSFIVERNVYDHDPQHLQWDHTYSALSDNERYCYCARDNDSREVSGQGWWKATSHVKKIYASNNNGGCGVVIGYKRPLTFHRFKDNTRNRSNAIKTNWIMHEFTLHSCSTEWRLCKIKYKGKPSVQEELEEITRTGYKSIMNNNDFEACSSSMTVVGTQLLADHHDDVAEHQLQQQQQQQPQPLQQQGDQIMSTTGDYYYFADPDHQLEQAHSSESEQLFPAASSSLWSWQQQ